MKRQKRGLLQISLRAFFVLTTLVAIACGTFLPSILRQQIAVATIEKHGGSVKYDFPDNAATSKIPGWMVDLLGEDTFFRVAQVNINTRIENNAMHQNTKHEPDVWDALTSLPHVRRFSMDYSSVPSESFRKIRCLSELEEIYISDVVLDEESLESLASLKELRAVAIYRGKLSDSALDVFSQLPKLKKLTLEGEFSNAELATICEASTLTELELSGEGSTIDDDGIRHLAKLKKLKVINLKNSLITGDGLRQMAPMTSIKVFHLSKTNVTWNDADSFKKKLRPDVKFQGYLEHSKP